MVNRLKLLWRIQVIGGRKYQWGLAIREKDIAEWFQKMGGPGSNCSELKREGGEVECRKAVLAIC